MIKKKSTTGKKTSRTTKTRRATGGIAILEAPRTTLQANDDHVYQSGTEVLRSENLVKRYKKRVVVNDVTIDVRQGEIVGLLGPNGAGKTTTFYMVVGMVKPNAGRVFIDTKEITSLPMYQRARLGIGYLPQEASVFRRLTVRDNLMAVLQLTKDSRKEREDKCDRLLEDFGLTHVAKSYGYVLSGGERRRTEIARSLALDPRFMLLDEPFAGIDPIAVEEIMRIVKKLKARNLGILITDHNVHETLTITDRSYLLFEGKILKSGSAEYLANDPEARKLYLGESFKLDRYDVEKLKTKK
jgi:lipopolysaccharide export system ATP-binding protein